MDQEWTHEGDDYDYEDDWENGDWEMGPNEDGPITLDGGTEPEGVPYQRSRLGSDSATRPENWSSRSPGSKNGSRSESDSGGCPNKGSDEDPGFESSKGRSHGTKPEGVPSHRPRMGSGSETWSGEDTYGDEEVRSTQGDQSSDQSSEDDKRQDALFPYGEERSEVLSNVEGRNDYFPKEERHEVLFSEKNPETPLARLQHFHRKMKGDSGSVTAIYRPGVRTLFVHPSLSCRCGSLGRI